MTPLVSKRHKLKFYLTTALSSVFLIAMGAFILVRSFTGEGIQAGSPRKFFLPVFGICFILLAIYFIYQYNKNAPFIQITHSGISFNGHEYLFSELEHIDLTGKRNFPFFLAYPMEAAKLQFRNGEKKFIFDDMYENAWQMKALLQQLLVDPKEDPSGSEAGSTRGKIVFEYSEVFKGSVFFSFRGLILWGLILFLLIILLTGKKPFYSLSTLVMIFFSLVWFFFSANTMDYFIVTSTHLTVKNQLLPWRNKSYPLAAIHEIVFETQGKMPNCLRVITNDFKTKLYLAGTLTDHTWIELKDKLEGLHIVVRNECIYYK